MYRITLHTVIIAIALVFSLSSLGQVKQTMQAALAQGDVETISSLFTPQVDLTLLEQDDLFSKSEASTLLKNFFTIHKPSKFKELHAGSSSAGLNYIIGSLTTSTGTYRVSYYYKGSSAAGKVQQLMIDEE